MPRECFINRFWVGHGFTACGITYEGVDHREKCVVHREERVDHRGRAALQGRVTRVKSVRALARVVVLLRQIASFRSFSSRAAQALEKCGL